MKNILITGGTGFLGRELIKYLVSQYAISNITVLARNEGNLIKLKQQYPDIDILTGSVEDECIVKKACEGKDTLFHLAAYKHVGLAETQSYQCTMSNVYGTVNLIKHFKGNLFVAISTDKTAKISGVYGASKRIMEKLLDEQSKINKHARYIIPRYGNVIGSTGSIVPKWVDAATNHQPITITEPTATRFFFTVEDAVNLIFEAIDKAESGKPYIKKMKSCYVGTMASAIEQKYGKFESIDVIGLQEGENMHEWLDNKYCSKDAKKLSTEDLKEII